MSEGKSSRRTVKKDINSPKNDVKIAQNSPKTPKKGAKIPGFGSKSSRNMGKDTDIYGNTFEVFSQSGKVLGYATGYGSVISPDWLLFYSQREPVGYWWVVNVGNDVWDNWFSVRDIEKPDDMALDKSVQRWMNILKAKVQLPRETVFERRYGTAILLMGYMEPNMKWETPLFTPEIGEKLPKIDAKLLQITPYPWVDITNVELDDEPTSYRYGLPEYYTISIGNANTETPLPSGMTRGTMRVHWTRVIHDAQRQDEHPYLGTSALDPIFDDLVGGRNARWGMYQGYYRNGQGFPSIQTTGTKKENEDWVAAGGVEGILNARGYFVHGPDEKIEFVGSQGVALNPVTYFDAYFAFISGATSVTADFIKGISAGRVTGNEAGERKYFKAISLLQHKKETMLRELTDRLIQTGQVEFDGEYFIEWVDPFEVNPQDKASIEYLQERTNALRMQSETIDEVRARKGMKPLPNGEGKKLLPLPGQFSNPSVGGAANQQEPEETKPPEQPTENPAEQGQSVAGEESTLFDKVKAGDFGG